MQLLEETVRISSSVTLLKQGIFSMLIVYSNLPYHANFIDIIFKNSFPADLKWEVYVLVRLQKSLILTDPAHARALPPAAFPLLLHNA